MVNKKLIIELLNFNIEKYQYYLRLYENTNDYNDKTIYWNNMFRLSSSLIARKQMCMAFGYCIIYDDNGKVTDIVEK